MLCFTDAAAKQPSDVNLCVYTRWGRPRGADFCRAQSLQLSPSLGAPASRCDKKNARETLLSQAGDGNPATPALERLW